jgi:DNA polymerase III subunit delta
MRLKPEQLVQHLQDPVAPVYLICGDEPLLAQEAADAIRSAARSQGFEEREVFHADGHFDWQHLLAEANSPSLFAARKILEVRINSGKPGDKGSKALVEYCASPSPDNLMLVITPKLDASALRSKWASALDKCGVLIQVWPVKAHEMPRWIRGRLQQSGIRASGTAIEILADRVEGNLLAAKQEIEKLALLAPGGEVDAETMSTVVADSARYNIFDLIDRILSGDGQIAARMLRGLRDEGAEPLAILGILTRELRLLIQAAEARQFHSSMDDVFRKHRVWEKRQALLKGALRRLKLPHLKILLRQAAMVDRSVKGMRVGDPWDDLNALILSFAGSPTLSGASIRLALNE